jgi:hypothetical protein
MAVGIARVAIGASVTLRATPAFVALAREGLRSHVGRTSAITVTGVELARIVYADRVLAHERRLALRVATQRIIRVVHRPGPVSA